jgi:uncharacterized protein YraI
MRTIKFIFPACCVIFLALGPAAAQNGCFGTVTGLSDNYNPRTGSGFLALRAGPTTQASQSGELFNGDALQIVGKNGSWFRVTTSEGRNGWVSRQYVNQRCGL